MKSNKLRGGHIAMMEDKLQFLEKYRKDVELIYTDEINTLTTDDLTSNWLNVLKEKDSRTKVEKTLKIWKEFVSIDLRNTISYLDENLIDIDLIKDNGNYSILYSVGVGDGEVDYYEGGIPNHNFNNPELIVAWPHIPSTIKNFYENLHNGFYYFPSRAMGLVPLENVAFFEDDEWGIIEELEEPLQINLNSTFGFFKSGMGGYVAIDYNNCDNDKATIWFSDEQPKYNADFWDVVDEWIVIGFE